MRIICDEESHAPKVAFIKHIEVSPNTTGRPGVCTGGEEDLISNVPADRAALFGDLIHPPTVTPTPDDYRSRHVLACKLCGLRVELRHENAQRIVEGFLAAGIFEVKLSALAANM